MPDTLEAAFEEATAEASGEDTTAPTDSLGDAPEPVEVEAEQPDVDAETPPKHQVKVRGQEIEVDYDELVNGYQRQADYTAKTQELAAERAQVESASTLWTHLQDDPAATLAALQEHYAEQLTETEGYDDPIEARLAAIEAQNTAQQQSSMEAEITAEMDRLTEEHGEFIRDDLLEFAIEQEIPNLEAALIYKAKLESRGKAEADRLQAKKTAPPISNRSTAAGTSAAPEPEVDSFDGALAAALSDLGIKSIMDTLD